MFILFQRFDIVFKRFYVPITYTFVTDSTADITTKISFN